LSDDIFAYTIEAIDVKTDFCRARAVPQRRQICSARSRVNL